MNEEQEELLERPEEAGMTTLTILLVNIVNSADICTSAEHGLTQVHVHEDCGTSQSVASGHHQFLPEHCSSEAAIGVEVQVVDIGTSTEYTGIEHDGTSQTTSHGQQRLSSLEIGIQADDVGEPCRNASKETTAPASRSHTGRKSFICTACGKGFGQMGDLRRHARTHTGEKPFSCAICDKSFNQHVNLKTHMRTHTGERRFTCAVCKQRFSRNDHLKTHTRTHTGEKPFGCTFCDQRFSRNYDLKTHVRTHTGEKPFPCALCDKSFNDSTNAKKHMRTHTGEKPFTCTVCQQNFSRNGNLKTHMKIHAAEGQGATSATVRLARARKKNAAGK